MRLNSSTGEVGGEGVGGLLDDDDDDDGDDLTRFCRGMLCVLSACRRC